MHLKNALKSHGIFQPAEISLLRSAYEKLDLPEDTDIDRETRAAALIRLFSSGMQSEEELLKAFGHTSGD